MLLGLFFAIVASLLPVFPTMGKSFLIAIEQKHYPDAYLMFSDNFKQQYDYPTFERNIALSGLDQYKSVVWMKNVQDRKQKNGYIVGLITMKDDKKVPIEIDFIDQQGESLPDKGWRIESFKLLPPRNY